MEKNTNPWNELVTIKKTHPDAKTREIAGMYLSQLNTASGSILIGKEAANWANENKVPDFETGATSSAVNELILYTDNDRDLVVLRDSIYESLDISKTPPYYRHFLRLLIGAERTYFSEFGRRINANPLEQKEYCQIYANRYAEWKKEKELELYNEYRTAKLDIGEEPMTFEQWKAAENDLSDYDTK